MVYILGFLIVSGILISVFSPYQISGNSMSPTYKDKDIILSTRFFSKKHLKKGDVVLFTSPNSGHTAIKRILYFDYSINNFFLLGDNANESMDSRVYGLVPSSYIFGKVIKPRQKG